MCVEVDKVIAEPDAKVALADRVAAPKVVTHMDDPAAVTDDGSVPIYAAIKMYFNCSHVQNSRTAQRKTPHGGKKTPQYTNDTSKSSAQPSSRWKSLGIGTETPIPSPQISSKYVSPLYLSLWIIIIITLLSTAPKKARGSVDLTSQISKRKSSISSIKSRSR